MKLTLVLMATMIGVSGCQTIPYQGQARNVSMKPKKEGVISIPAQYREEDRQKATGIMNSNCSPLSATVLEEGEVAVGTKTDSNQRENKRKSSEVNVGSLFGVPLVSGEPAGTDTAQSTMTTQLKEWHISYKCEKSRKSL